MKSSRQDNKRHAAEYIGQQRQFAIPQCKATKTPHYIVVQQACRNTLVAIAVQPQRIMRAQRARQKTNKK